MKKITLVGDCHSFNIGLAHDELGMNFIPFTVWGKGGYKAWQFYPQQLFETGLVSDSGVSFSEIVDEGVVFIWLGYNDIKTALPCYKDSYETVDRLVKNSRSYFKKAKLVFIEPLVQFNETLMMFPGEHDDYSYIERKEQNDLFLERLRFLKLAYNLNIISQEDICGILGFKKPTPDMTQQADSLQLKYYIKLYGFLINYAMNINNS